MIELDERDKMAMVAVASSFSGFGNWDWEKMKLSMVEVKVKMPLLLIASVKRVLNEEPEDFVRACIQTALRDMASLIAEKYVPQEEGKKLLGKVLDETKHLAGGDFREAEARVIKKMLGEGVKTG